MKKILLGVLGVMVAGSVTFATARALFTATATVNSIHIKAGTAGLEVGPNDSSTSTSWSVSSGWAVDGFYPGWGETDNKHTNIVVKNTGNSVPMSIKAQLTNVNSTDWANDLKYAVEVAVNGNGGATGYQSLLQWNAGAISLPGTIAQGNHAHYIVYMRVPRSYGFGYYGGKEVGNEIAGKYLQSIEFTLTGTQSN
ncbi:hypothetical protein MUP32_06520 [Candidatus Microgenomates bacterium]|nr:hypothetical protein [Candidatus Microgenomates bacterium]